MPLKGTVGPGWIGQMLLVVSIAATCGALSGCAEGPFWRAGKYSPWAKQKWAEEERIADTLSVRRRRMTESVNSVINAPVEDQQRIANELAETLHRDPVILLRLHAVKLFSQLNCPAAIQALEAASHDQTSDIRIAAVKAWGNMPAETAIPHLQEMIGSDTNADVRMAATRALGNFSGQKAVAAISLALDDQDPALQFRAVESLQKVTGEPLGRDISAWQQYVRNVIPNNPTIKPDSSLPSETQSNGNYQNVADEAIDLHLSLEHFPSWFARVLQFALREAEPPRRINLPIFTTQTNHKIALDPIRRLGDDATILLNTTHSPSASIELDGGLRSVFISSVLVTFRSSP